MRMGKGNCPHFVRAKYRRKCQSYGYENQSSMCPNERRKTERKEKYHNHTLLRAATTTTTTIIILIIHCIIVFKGLSHVALALSCPRQREKKYTRRNRFLSFSLTTVHANLVGRCLSQALHQGPLSPLHGDGVIHQNSVVLNMKQLIACVEEWAWQKRGHRRREGFPGNRTPSICQDVISARIRRQTKLFFGRAV